MTPSPVRAPREDPITFDTDDELDSFEQQPFSYVIYHRRLLKMKRAHRKLQKQIQKLMRDVDSLQWHHDRTKSILF